MIEMILAAGQLLMGAWATLTRFNRDRREQIADTLDRIGELIGEIATAFQTDASPYAPLAELEVYAGSPEFRGLLADAGDLGDKANLLMNGMLQQDRRYMDSEIKDSYLSRTEDKLSPETRTRPCMHRAAPSPKGSARGSSSTSRWAQARFVASPDSSGWAERAQARVIGRRRSRPKALRWQRIPGAAWRRLYSARSTSVAIRRAVGRSHRPAAAIPSGPWSASM